VWERNAGSGLRPEGAHAALVAARPETDAVPEGDPR
jgi:hypothetical protein